MKDLKMDMNFNQLAVMFQSATTENNFFVLHERIKPVVMKHISNFIKDKETADDVFADVMMTIYSKIGQYNPKFAFMTWVYRISYIHSLWVIKRQNKQCSIDVSFDENDENYISAKTIKSISTDFPEYEFYEKETDSDAKFDRVLMIMDRMPETFREIVIDRELSRLSMLELAEKHNLCENTIKTKLRCGRKWIKEIYETEYSDTEILSFF
jgi:RNA polymerase sigma-70 factor (ECF subfamily)